MGWQEDMFGVVNSLKGTEALLINLNKLVGSTTIEKAAGDVTWAIERLGTLTRELGMKEKECNGKTDDSKMLDEFEERLAARRAAMIKKEEAGHPEEAMAPPASAPPSEPPVEPDPKPETPTEVPAATPTEDVKEEPAPPSKPTAPPAYRKPTFPTY